MPRVLLSCLKQNLHDRDAGIAGMSFDAKAMVNWGGSRILTCPKNKRLIAHSKKPRRVFNGIAVLFRHIGPNQIDSLLPRIAAMNRMQIDMTLRRLICFGAPKES